MEIKWEVLKLIAINFKTSQPCELLREYSFYPNCKLMLLSQPPNYKKSMTVNAVFVRIP